MAGKETGFIDKAKNWLQDTGEHIKSGIENVTGVGTEKAKEGYHGTQYEHNKNVASDPNRTVGERLDATKEAGRHKMEEKNAQYNKEQYKGNLDREFGTQDTTGSNVGGMASDKVNQKGYEVNRDFHKERAKDPNQPISTRLSDAKDALTSDVRAKGYEQGYNQKKDSLF